MKNLSFELNEEMLKNIENEFSPDKISKEYCNSINGKSEDDISMIGKKLFMNYGQKLMETSKDFGEQYPDRTYEVLREAADRTQSMYFPLMPQRFIEIAFLSIQSIPVLSIVENTSRRFIFNIRNCKIFKNIEEKCGKKIAQELVCKHGCLEACRHAFDGFGINKEELVFDMIAKTTQDGYCSFQVSKMGGNFGWSNFPEKITYKKKRKKK